MLIAAPAHVSAIQSPGWRADPYPMFAELRRDLPIARLDWPMRGSGDWLVTRHADVTATLRDPTFVISRRGAGARGDRCPHGRDPNEPLQRTVLTTDGPQYVALRNRTARAIGGITPAIEHCVVGHIQRIARDLTHRERFDLIDDLARPICEAIWCDLMLIDAPMMSRLSDWSAAYLEQGFIFGHGAVKSSASEAVVAMRRVLGATLATNSAHDRLGYLRAIAHIQQGPDDAASAVNTAVLLTAAMLQSVKHALVNCMVLLIARPDDWQRIRMQPALAPQAIEECLRFDGPSQAVGRIATSASCIAGQPLERGAFVRLAVASANRDGTRFADPDRFDLDRARLPHLGFGHAFHSCAGARLARLILQTAVSSLTQALERPIIDPNMVERDLESSLRGYVRVPVISAAYSGK